MAYKIGDKGLVPEFINIKLGLPGNIITEETVTRLKQFQCSFGQHYEDKTQELTYIFANGELTYQPLPTGWSIYNEYYSPENPSGVSNLPIIFPTGFVDIFTLPSICGIELYEQDMAKIIQAQTCLKGTSFNNTAEIQINGIYDDTTINAIRNFQMYYSIGQPTMLITEGKNLFPNTLPFWYNGKATDYEPSSNTVVLTPDDYTISSNLIPINNDYNHVFSNNQSGVGYILNFLFYDKTKTLLNTSAYPGYEMYNTDSYFSSGTLPANPNSTTKIAYVQCIVKFVNGDKITVNDILACPIQLERGLTPTSFEPQTLNPYYHYYSGRLNIVTYNKLKAVYGIVEDYPI